MNDARESASADQFDNWTLQYGDFYPRGSRLDREFRLTRKLLFTARRWTNLVDGLIRARTGQTRGRWEILFALAHSGAPMTTSALSERMYVQWPTLVRVLDGLERDGLVARTENPDDKRSRLITLSAEGLRVTRQVQPILDNARSEILGDLSEDELELCTALLDRIMSRTTSWRVAAAE